MTGVTADILAKRAELVRTGGKGSVRRTTKAHHKSSAGDDKKIQGVLRRLGVAPFSDVDEAIFYRQDGTVMQFEKPKVQAAVQSQCFVVSGEYTVKQESELAHKAVVADGLCGGLSLTPSENERKIIEGRMMKPSSFFFFFFFFLLLCLVFVFFPFYFLTPSLGADVILVICITTFSLSLSLAATNEGSIFLNARRNLSHTHARIKFPLLLSLVGHPYTSILILHIEEHVVTQDTTSAQNNRPMGDISVDMREYTFPSGAAYKGGFKGNLRHGQGYWLHPNGEQYEGQYQANKKHGLGVYRFKDTGKEYIGEWAEDKMEGGGVYYFNRDHTAMYFGTYSKDKKHGKGLYQYENGLLTSQEWNNGELVHESALPPQELVDLSLGLRRLVEKVRAVAPKLLGEMPAASEVRAFQFPSGATYTGQYFGTKKHGTGQWLHPEGDRYEGQFEFNKHHGWGVYTIGRSGKKYVGEWRAGKMNGIGVYFFTPEESEYYVGPYKNDVKHGKGMYHFASNQKNKVQYWEDGTLVKEENATPEDVTAYEETIQKIIDVVRPFAPEYEQRIFVQRPEEDDREEED
eukprot:gene8146-5678_t